MTFRGNHVDELISASLTGDLTDAERAQLDAHLARCETCRATLAAFTAERRILSGLPVGDPPRDLSARVRAGIQSGRLGQPWWRRPSGLIAIGASVATVAAAVLAIVVFGNFQFGPVGQASGSPEASLSFAPSASVVASAAPSLGPTTPPAFLGPGELGYFELTGAPFEASALKFVNDATGASLDAGTVSGPPLAAALSPDGQWLAYITQKGESGAHEVWVLHLTDGEVTPLGCSMAGPFTDRLAWSPDGTSLAFTLISIDLGAGSGCPAEDGALGTADVWVFDAANNERHRLTRSGNAYAASFMSDGSPATLLISFAAESPWTEAIPLGADPTNVDRIEGVFLPLVSPDGGRAIFWNGTMASSGGMWQFSLGGMPQISGDFRAAGPAAPWVGTPLFTDLVPVGGEAFAYGTFTWGVDDRFAFWNGAWTGAPQGGTADAPYPTQSDGYLGFLDGGLLSITSQRAGGVMNVSRIVDVTFGPGGDSAITIGFPSAGIGDPPSANVVLSPPCCGGEAHVIGGGADPPPWDGPAVFGR